MQRITLMGCQIDNLSMEDTLVTVEGFIQSGQPHQYAMVNVDKLVKASRDESLRRVINDCALVNADGMPVVWAARRRQGLARVPARRARRGGAGGAC